jgi:hypothetical protein
VGLDGGDGVRYKRGGVGERSKIMVSKVVRFSPATEVVAAVTWFVALLGILLLVLTALDPLSTATDGGVEEDDKATSAS